MSHHLALMPKPLEASSLIMHLIVLIVHSSLLFKQVDNSGHLNEAGLHAATKIKKATPPHIFFFNGVGGGG